MVVRKIVLIAAIISALGSSSALADGTDTTISIHLHDSHQQMNSEQESHDSKSHLDRNQEGHESEQSEQGHHKEVVETPPNFTVLGIFATINLLFIMIGVWMKWFKKKGVTA